MILSPGQAVMTAALHHLCQRSDALRLFCQTAFLRHLDGDWGDCAAEDAQLNDQALASGDGRIISVYAFPHNLTSLIRLPDDRLWIITYPGDHTTLLFPHEY